MGMTRIRYKYDMDRLVSDPFYITSNTILHIFIYKDYTYQIVDQNHTEIHFGQCSSLRMCKINAKAKLKELGVIFYEEVRKA